MNVLREKVAQLPRTPGVYHWLDGSGTILYIGKAKRIRDRTRSYFSATDAKTTLLMSKARDIRVIETRTEVEALLLENRLISQHRPQYNIALKETRRYAWILVTQETFPRIITTRNKRRKGKYFGPYTDGTARRQIIVTLNRVFKLRTCRTLPKRVCLQYHIGNCSGPCAEHDTQATYAARVKQAVHVLEGKTKELVVELTTQMKQAASKQHFERAKELRDHIKALQELQGYQVVERDVSHDQDIIASYSDEEEAVFIVMHIRRGVIKGKEEYRLDNRAHITEEFLSAYYRERTPPQEIITHGLTDNAAVILSRYFSQLTGATVRVMQPQRGEKKALLELGAQNAQSAAAQEDPALQRLAEVLRLAAPPRTIDCFDISTHHGTETVGASIRYRDGKPDPSEYRRFRIRNAIHDDFASMKEAISRRYRDKSDLPDLIVIDGGKGQLSAAREALAPFGVVPVISIAKKDEELFVPGLSFPIKLDEKDAGLLLLRRLRDAVHRFVINYHRKRRRASMSESMLDHIPGLGPGRKQRLYDVFKTFSQMKKATKSDLQHVLGKKLGESAFDQLHK